MSGKSQNSETEKLIQELSDKVDNIKKTMPNGELTALLNDIKIVISQQNEMGNNINDVKHVIMDPEDGLIVRVNKNTSYRVSLQEQETDNSKILEEHQDLVKFKENVTKILWMVVAAIIGIITKILFFGN